MKHSIKVEGSFQIKDFKTGESIDEGRLSLS